ncbi:MAG: hypothetical protein SGILL_006732, partial [Bacillariaceae sp.]
EVKAGPGSYNMCPAGHVAVGRKYDAGNVAARKFNLLCSPINKSFSLSTRDKVTVCADEKEQDRRKKFLQCPDGYALTKSCIAQHPYWPFNENCSHDICQNSEWGATAGIECRKVTGYTYKPKSAKPTADDTASKWGVKENTCVVKDRGFQHSDREITHESTLTEKTSLTQTTSDSERNGRSITNEVNLNAKIGGEVGVPKGKLTGEVGGGASRKVQTTFEKEKKYVEEVTKEESKVVKVTEKFVMKGGHHWMDISFAPTIFTAGDYALDYYKIEPAKVTVVTEKRRMEVSALARETVMQLNDEQVPRSYMIQKTCTEIAEDYLNLRGPFEGLNIVEEENEDGILVATVVNDSASEIESSDEDGYEDTKEDENENKTEGDGEGEDNMSEDEEQGLSVDTDPALHELGDSAQDSDGDEHGANEHEDAAQGELDESADNY